ncbi:methyltransferase family protein [Anaeromyxobacter oryzae]|uniref:Isoprenylcysteine carboxyl methyltransferase n=1 Tax=Anaeromyxobacter oryzae TaxID=2918170 RepID=A0ABM7WPD3_9BACT|nr:isoprenylcysteine carboxylmethyltransferase family protein [Anaeromyxobacter oryzae]BDG01320.1 hypothetical protein AMOR_03160 [Anaeromyxobacter oryzae]
MGARGIAALRGWNVAVFAAWLVIPFLAAGTIAWASGWLHHGVLAAALLAHGAYVARRNPALRARRRAVGEGAKSWDLWWNAAFWPLMAGIAVSAGVGHRLGAAPLPAPVAAFGAILLGLALALSARAMAVNPFFEGTVRIQHDVGHHVVDSGPYARVRHPGYLGLVGWALASPLLLRSAPALPAAIAAAAWVVLRTALEDATLARELPGYAAYARRVRWRLVPGVW